MRNQSMTYDFSSFESGMAIDSKMVANQKQKSVTWGRGNGILFAVLCLVLVGLLFNNVYLTEASAEVSSLRNELKKEQNETITLQAKLEQLTSLKVVEDYAKDKLGMTPAMQHQFEYVNSNNQSRVAILKAENASVLGNLYMALSKTFNIALEYIR